ncbi:MAG: glycosyltransferase family 1 protein [Acidobacteriota bacterium]
MKVVIDCRKLRDLGIGTYIDGLVSQLRRLDSRNDYVLLCFRQDAERLRQYFPTRVVSAGLYSAAELVQISRAVASERAHLFHSPHYVLPFFLPCRTVVTVHDLIHVLFPEYLRGAAERFYARFFLRRAMCTASAVITVSDTSRSDMIGRYPGAAGRLHRVYNGVQPCFTTCVVESRGDPPYFLFVGNNKPHKNLPVLLRAFEDVRSETRELRLRIAGFERGLERLPEGAEVLGYVSQERLVELYRSALALVCPSRYEGFGLPAIEAQASGCPVAASDIPVFRETLGGSALLCREGDAGTVASAMRRLLDEPGLREELIRRGRANILRFSFESCAQETLAIYERVAAASA